MPKMAKRGEDEPTETAEHVSPPKKAKIKENKGTTGKVSTLVENAAKRLPRAAKTRAAARATNVEPNNNNVEPKKPRGKQPLRRSKSSDSLVPEHLGDLKKSKISLSAEELNRVTGPAKKTKATKKPAAKKAGSDANPRKGASKKAPLEDLDEEEAKPPMIAKKSYAKGASKKVSIASEEPTIENEKPKKRVPAKKPMVGVKATRGRGKAVARGASVEADGTVEGAKVAKPRKPRANPKKTAITTTEEDKDAEGDEETAEGVGNHGAVADHAKVAKPRKGRANAKKAMPMTEEDKDTEPEEENGEALNAEEPTAEDAKTAKSKKGKANAKKATALSSEEDKDTGAEEENSAGLDDEEDTADDTKPKRGK